MSLACLNPGSPLSYMSYSEVSFSPGKPPSYMHNESGDSFLYSEEDLEEISFLPVIELNGKKVIFTLSPQHQPALYYKKRFISTIRDVLQLVRFFPSLDQELLDKIATMTNYLYKGTDYEYLPHSAKMKEEEIYFMVKHECELCKVKLPLSEKNCEVIYEEADEIEV
ncbi:hypothetical protein [Candidatus Protochlamydia phocaeensis]|uniref:hypothetical protein n=1 Tax=Candidatus Protochlamydia phocaeensis TaxID=1414722 RepID=UPI0008396E9C|nr:hypothetical protein [Candidatus Protochlamydia phocaeensis]